MAAPGTRIRVDVSRWNVVYPIYLEKTKKISEGRKVPLRVAAENVSVVDLVDAAKMLGLPHGLEVRSGIQYRCVVSYIRTHVRHAENQKWAQFFGASTFVAKYPPLCHVPGT